MDITAEERALMIPGPCLRCGERSELDRNSAGRCGKCHNVECRERRQIMRRQLKDQREVGRKYWAERGIFPGNKVKRVAVSMLGIGAQEVYGIAKVGKVGAYVSSRFQAGYLSPHGWSNAG